MRASPVRRGRSERPTLAAIKRLLPYRGFRNLFVTRAISQMGDGVFQLAATDLLLFKNPGGNPAWTLTKLSAITLVPFSLVVPFVGVFIDRWDRRRILTVTPIVRTAFIALVPLATRGTADRPWFYGIVLVVLSANRFFLATMSAVLPDVVQREEDLLVANSIATTGGSIANVVGLGIGASLSALVGGTKAGMVGGVAFLAAAALARTIPLGGGHPEQRVPLGAAIARVLREMREGFGRVLQSRRATFGFAVITAMQTLIGAAVATAAVVYIVRLHLGVGAVSSLLAVLAVGVFAGVVSVPAVARRIGPERVPSAGFAIGAAATVATGTLISLAHVSGPHPNGSLARAAITGGSLFAGAAFAFAKIPVDTMIQEALPDVFRGRAFASYDMLYNIARVVGTALAAWAVAAHLGEPSIVLAVGAAYVLAALASRRGARRLGAAVAPGSPEARRDPVTEEPRRDAASHTELRSSPLPAGELVTVRAYAGARAEESPRAIVVGAREFPIERIDWQAVEERAGVRKRIFVVRAAGVRVRLAYDESSDLWEIEREIAREGS